MFLSDIHALGNVMQYSFCVTRTYIKVSKEVNFSQHVSLTNIFLSNNEEPFQPSTVIQGKHFLIYMCVSDKGHTTLGKQLSVKNPAPILPTPSSLLRYHSETSTCC